MTARAARVSMVNLAILNDFVGRVFENGLNVM